MYRKGAAKAASRRDPQNVRGTTPVMVVAVVVVT
jgi:hypothetical protein